MTTACDPILFYIPLDVHSTVSALRGQGSVTSTTRNVGVPLCTCADTNIYLHTFFIRTRLLEVVPDAAFAMIYVMGGGVQFWR